LNESRLKLGEVSMSSPIVRAVHLLNLQFQPERETRSWRSTIIEQADS